MTVSILTPNGLETVVRVFLAAFFLMIGLHYTSISLALFDRMGFSHIHYGRRGSRTWWGRHLFNLFRAAILVVCLVRVVWPIDPWLGVVELPFRPYVEAFGAVLLLLSFYIIDYVHGYMHMDWRSGIDPDADRPLLTEGPFARSRNPLFIGILIGQFGFLLALPSLFSLICWLVGVAVIIQQALAEEKALSAIYGERYADYRRRVPRWW